MPQTSVKLTWSPSSSPWRVSSCMVTTPCSSCETEATMPETGSSPLESTTTKSSPKSQNREPKRPWVEHMMKRPPVLRHASLMRVASDKEMPVATTMPNVLRNSAESSPVCSLMGTYWFSSARCGSVAVARDLPMSSSRRKNWADRSESVATSLSYKVTDLTPPSTTFLAISTPRPPRPTNSTDDAIILRIASCPSTYSCLL
mmetsp:Transcript_19726/g.64152  ORF Transcript_19726/g.64152 Transcript_19726/m.64152 type:complete len:202 (+) Transcript_19726:903-1508(+)